MKNRLNLFLSIFSGLLILSAPCVHAQNISIDPMETEDSFKLDDEWDIYAEPEQSNDPFERYNRWMFGVNDKIYRRVFNPISRGYDFLVPERAQEGISNVFRFVQTPIRFGNNLLQTKFKNAFTELERFLINGTIGVVGIFDPATSRFNIEQKSESFAQTLGHYGVPPGPYIVLPILGPSDPRNITGMVGDYFMNPLTWTRYKSDDDFDDAYTAYQIIVNLNNYSHDVRGTYEKITADAIDEYIALQEVYIQNRDKQLKE